MKPTDGEIEKVVAYLSNKGLSISCDPNLFILYDTTLNIDEVVEYVSQKNVQDAGISIAAGRYGVSKEILYQWLSKIIYNDVVLIKCSGLTTKGKPCKSVLMQCNGFEEWLANKDKLLYCDHHSEFDGYIQRTEDC